MARIAPIEYIRQGRKTKVVAPTPAQIKEPRREMLIKNYRIPMPSKDAGYTHVQTIMVEANLNDRSVRDQMRISSKKFYDHMAQIPGFQVLSTDVYYEGRNGLGTQYIYITVIYLVEDQTSRPYIPEPAYARFTRDPSTVV